MRPLSPIQVSHREACRFGRRSLRAVRRARQVVIYGRRGNVKYPLMSILVAQDLGNCRHALAQRVVAGTMTVHYAPGDGPSKAKPSPPGSGAAPQPPPTSSPPQALRPGQGAPNPA